MILLGINVTFLPSEYSADPFVPRRLGDLVLDARRESSHRCQQLVQVGDPPGQGLARRRWLDVVRRLGDHPVASQRLRLALVGRDRILALRPGLKVTLLAPSPEVNLEVGPIRPNVESDATRAARERRRATRAPNIVIFSIDGLRTDHVTAPTATKHPTTPNIDRFAERGVRFARAYSFFPRLRTSIRHYFSAGSCRT